MFWLRLTGTELTITRLTLLCRQLIPQFGPVARA